LIAEGAVLEVVSDGGGVDVPEEMAAPVPAPKPMQAERMEDARSAEMVAIAPIFLNVGRDVVVDSSPMVVVVVCGGRFSIELRVLIIDVVIPAMPLLLDVTCAPAVICCDGDDDDEGVVYGVIAASPSSYIFPPAASANPPERVAGFSIGLTS